MKKFMPWICSAVLAVAIYLISTAGIALIDFLKRFVYIVNSDIAIVILIMNLILQLCIVIVPTRIGIKRFGLTLKQIPVTIALILILFLIYEMPGTYIFLMTNQFGLMSKCRPMSQWEAALLLMLQYGIILLIIVAITRVRMIKKQKMSMENTKK